MRLAARMVLATALGVLGAATPASAGTVSLSGSTVTYEASPGEANHVKVAHALGMDGMVTVQDTGAPVVASGLGCVAVAHRATCISTGAIDAVTVFAGDRDDTIVVSDLAAEVHGGDGADAITTGVGNDLLDGGPGPDTLRGGSNLLGSDTVTYADRTAPVSVTPGDGANDGEAGEGDDVGVDIERIVGGAGNDTMVGPSDPYAREELIGGPGDDDLSVRIAGFADGGPGNDTLSSDDTPGDFAASLAGGPGDDHLIGGAGGDYMAGDDGADTLDGNGGNDALRGAAGDDIESGGAGNDDIDDHEGGADTVDGGAGDDRIYVRDPVEVHGGDGRDNLLIAPSGLGVNVSLDDVANDSIGGRASNVHSDIELFLGTFYDDVIVGSAGDDSLNGALGNDTIEGKGGKDVLVGGSGTSNLILARDGEPDEVSCGNGASDQAQVDPVETVVDGCETLLP